MAKCVLAGVIHHCWFQTEKFEGLALQAYGPRRSLVSSQKKQSSHRTEWWPFKSCSRKFHCDLFSTMIGTIQPAASLHGGEKVRARVWQNTRPIRTALAALPTKRVDQAVGLQAGRAMWGSRLVLKSHHAGASSPKRPVLEWAPSWETDGAQMKTLNFRARFPGFSSKNRNLPCHRLFQVAEDPTNSVQQCRIIIRHLAQRLVCRHWKGFWRFKTRSRPDLDQHVGHLITCKRTVSLLPPLEGRFVLLLICFLYSDNLKHYYFKHIVF